jgi:hypothetical protein
MQQPSILEQLQEKDGQQDSGGAVHTRASVLKLGYVGSSERSQLSVPHSVVADSFIHMSPLIMCAGTWNCTYNP